MSMAFLQGDHEQTQQMFHPDRKQLEGESGTAEEVTEEYRELLILVLLLWITRNKNIRLEDQQAVNNALLALETQLEQVAIEELPVAFAMGSGGPVANFGEIAELGALTVENQFFLDGSFVPYMLADLAPTDNMLATIGDIAAVRQSAWASRIGLYAGAFWTAIWLGLGFTLLNRLLQNTAPTRRLLDPGAEHCGTCPGKALEYGSWNEMLAWTGGLPADGSDDCHSNCRCQIEVFIEGEWIGTGI